MTCYAIFAGKVGVLYEPLLLSVGNALQARLDEQSFFHRSVPHVRRAFRNRKSHSVVLLKDSENRVVIRVRSRNTLRICGPRLMPLRLIAWVKLELKAGSRENSEIRRSSAVLMAAELSSGRQIV